MELFNIEIMTPERLFYKNKIEALTVTLPDGELTVLAGHIPMTAALEVGMMRLKKDGIWHECTNSEGFLEVRPDRVIIFAQACEYPDEINENRAREALERATERMRHRQSLREHAATKAALARAMARLRVTNSSKGKY